MLIVSPTLRALAAPFLPGLRRVLHRKERRELVPWLETVSAAFGGLVDKAILDVGCDVAGTMVGVLDERFSPREVVGLNLDVADTRVSRRACLEKGDIRHSRFPDGYFDLILSSSAFEHISGMETAIAEMHRILKSGGYLFSHFGPIWSTSYGHHLWVTHEGRLYNYWNVVLPPYCHLLQTRHEIEALLRQRGYEAGLSGMMAEFVTASPQQNQLFFEDYERIFAESEFDVIFFKGYDHPQLAPVYNAAVTPALLDRLRERHPDKRHFFYDGITTLMRKR